VKSVKWPIDYVVSTLRLLGVKPEARRYTGLALEDSDSLRSHLDDMGQRLFDPPSVFGWDWERRGSAAPRCSRASASRATSPPHA
jgi:uncharacterized protein (DUF1800 family)